jgi:uncharacterized damage-inducible protein DinB
MSLSESLLPEFDQEMKNARKSLGRIPGDKLGWKPHEKSWSMGSLGTHLANIPNWAVLAVSRESFDTAPPGAPPPKAPPLNSAAEILEAFDRNVTAARAAIAGASDECLLKPWTLLSGGNAVLKLPRMAVLRTFVMNHLIHHRAQLGVYLRLNDVPVPSIYGPSADE